MIKSLITFRYQFKNINKNIQKQEGYNFQILLQLRRMLQKEGKIFQNEQTLKYFISTSEQNIPDITHQSNFTDIFSHFRFFFNDPHLAIFSLPSRQSVMHDPKFQTLINQTHHLWVQSHNKKDNSEGNTRNSSKENNQNFFNFIAFTQFWIRKTPNLEVVYSPYTQLVQQTVNDFMENKIYQLSCDSNKKNFQQKLQAKKEIQNAKLKSKKAVCKLSQETQIEKRLQKLFQHFAHSHKSSTKNSTFDQIKEDCVTLNLNQWVAVIKKVCQPENSDQVKQKKVNSVRNIKNIFERNCSNCKKMNYKQFKSGLEIYFKTLLITESEQEAMKRGRIIMKLGSDKEFKDKMRSLGAFVTDEVTIIQNPSPIVPKKIVPKFMEPKKLLQIPKNLNLQKSMKLSSVKVNASNFYHPLSKPNNNRTGDANFISLSSLNPNKQNRIKMGKKLQFLTDEKDEDPFLTKYFDSSHQNLIERMDQRIEKFQRSKIR